ncbi:MAG: ABC transporter substrate-binding protein [Anaerorhabdus sp.]
MKKMMKLMVALLVVASLVGCSSSTASDDAVVIGTMGPYEGEYSVYGLAVRNGVELAIQEANEAGGILGKEIKLISYDTKGDVTEATNSYFKLVDNDGAVAIVGGTLSGESIAIGEASQGIGTPIISPSATALSFTLTGSNVFRGAFTDPFQAQQMGEFAKQELGAQTAAIIYDSGSDYSEGLMDSFKAEFEAQGGEVLLVEAYASQDKDFNTQLTKILAANPDVLFVPNYYQDNVLIAKQARDLGITATLLGGDGWDGVLSVAEDASSLEGAIFCNHYSPDDTSIVEWATQYKETYGTDPTAFSYLAYDSTKIMLQSIVDANSTDSEAIVNALQAMQFEGILGHIEFDENGDPIKDLGYIIIRDGVYTSYK